MHYMDSGNVFLRLVDSCFRCWNKFQRQNSTEPVRCVAIRFSSFLLFLFIVVVVVFNMYSCTYGNSSSLLDTTASSSDSPVVSGLRRGRASRVFTEYIVRHALFIVVFLLVLAAVLIFSIDEVSGIMSCYVVIPVRLYE